MSTPNSTWQNIGRRVDRVGAGAFYAAGTVRRYYEKMAAILSVGLRLRWLARPAVMHVVIRQIYFTGVQSVVWVLVIALAAGVVAVYNIVIFAKSIEDLSLIGRLISGLLVQEVAPLMVTIFMLARSGVAVVTEIGTMHIRGEDIVLRSLGVSVNEYLLWPRVMAFTICGLILTFLFLLVSIWFGGMVVAWSYELNLIDFFVEVRRGSSLNEFGFLIAKGALYPMLCSIMLLNQGCQVGRDPNMIPVRATHGVLGSLMLVLLVDVFLVLLQETL
ncbi:MAG TPA: ABC transporter permease [Mariprofundaceae bacterium]|nr:ABC transporter permease [Mariprofundaceae bacterium]